MSLRSDLNADVPLATPGEFGPLSLGTGLSVDPPVVLRAQRLVDMAKRTGLIPEATDDPPAALTEAACRIEKQFIWKGEHRFRISLQAAMLEDSLSHHEFKRDVSEHITDRNMDAGFITSAHSLIAALKILGARNIALITLIRMN